MIVALSGGVGGAKLVRGLSLTDHPITTIVNTADDFKHWGLHISPDLDSVMYALADLSDPVRGWGVRDESWNALEMVKHYQGESWFQLGDRDLATHLIRTQFLTEGQTLTQATKRLCDALKIKVNVLPMSDDLIQTQVETLSGWMDFQVYFVKERCEPEVKAVRFLNIEQAKPTQKVLRAIESATLIILCPSNPLVSLDPILHVPGIEVALQNAKAPVVAVSPLIGGQAIKGPTVEMLKGLGFESSPVTVASRYQSFLSGFVLDEQDQVLQADIESLGLEVMTTNTLMKTDEDKKQLAKAILKTWR